MKIFLSSILYMRIVLLGCDVDGSNMGCQALVYSFLSLLTTIYEKKIIAYIFTFGTSDLAVINKQYPNIEFIPIQSSLKSMKSQKNVLNIFNQCDFIFDITYGDGFSDIYGKIWNFRTNLNKELACQSKAKFVLLPQTYGPFYNFLLKRWAKHLVNKSDFAFSRDYDSALEFNKLLKKEKVKCFTDLAFLLPYEKQTNYSINKKVGLNISSTLWDEIHSGTINLKTDYKQYNVSLINGLLERGYEVHLIPHVIDHVNFNSPENDYRVCKELSMLNSNIILAQPFINPIQAKNYISKMDVFIGARMHATIGAFSSETITIPLAYSKKFEGLYGNLNYPYLIDLRDMCTDEALKKTFEYIDNGNSLELAQQKSMEKVSTEIERLKQELLNLISIKEC